MQSIQLLCEDSDKDVREQSRRCIHSGLLVYDESLIKIDMSGLNANANTNIRIWRSIEQEQESPKVHLKIREGLKEIKKNQIEIMNKRITRPTKASLGKSKSKRITNGDDESGLKLNDLLGLGSMVPVKRKRYIDIDTDEQQQQVIQDEQVEDKDAIRRKRIKKDEE
ncbi:MAG: hypothetical protein EZS28_023091 [Streblomastix strix]|uniref:Uncharacterized protein n=1 Tax=Streblomastix strix TaxID=222440 RepID=A0A5J4VFM0_9EUKA|nr:MAG: hypothetical protein EZS28_023091 [Streblomastix strix]